MADITTTAIIKAKTPNKRAIKVCTLNGISAANSLIEDFGLLTMGLENIFPYKDISGISIKGEKTEKGKKVVVTYTFFGGTQKIIEYTSNSINESEIMGVYEWQR